MTFLTHNCHNSNFSELPGHARLSGILIIVTYVLKVLRLKKKNTLPFIALSFKI